MVEIENAESLSDVFGHWPHCHDAEVRSLKFAAPGDHFASIEAELDIAEPSSEVDERGYYRVRAACRASLRFERVTEVRMDGFSFQNVLDELFITEAVGAVDPTGRVYPIAVEFRGIVGCVLTFHCVRVEVTAVTKSEAAI